jgi:hypothetical protein
MEESGMKISEEDSFENEVDTLFDSEHCTPIRMGKNR